MLEGCKNMREAQIGIKKQKKKKKRGFRFSTGVGGLYPLPPPNITDHEV